MEITLVSAVGIVNKNIACQEDHYCGVGGSPPRVLSFGGVGE